MHTNSPVWNDLLKVKRLYQQGRVMVVGDGKATDFWEDAWCGTVSLKENFSELFIISNNTSVTVAGLAQNGWRLSFRRWLNVPQQD